MTLPRKAAGSKAVAAAVKPRKEVKPTTADLDCCLGYSLRRAQLSTFQEFLTAMDEFAVRPSQYAVLVLIRSNPGLSQSSISGVLGIQKANFVALLDKLEDRGLTERRKLGGDRRSSALYLTKQGEQVVRRMEAAHQVHEGQLSARLGEKRSRQLLALLHDFCAGEPQHRG